MPHHQRKHLLPNFSRALRAVIVAAAFVGVAAASRGQGPVLTDRGAMPEFDEVTGWLNSPPLRRRSLRAKVVMVDFWTYTCINSLRPLPYLKNWVTKYRDVGL